jgi:hypothetical protein
MEQQPRRDLQRRVRGARVELERLRVRTKVTFM